MTTNKKYERYFARSNAWLSNRDRYIEEQRLIKHRMEEKELESLTFHPTLVTKAENSSYVRRAQGSIYEQLYNDKVEREKKRRDLVRATHEELRKVTSFTPKINPVSISRPSYSSKEPGVYHNNIKQCEVSASFSSLNIRAKSRCSDTNNLENARTTRTSSPSTEMRHTSNESSAHVNSKTPSVKTHVSSSSHKRHSTRILRGQKVSEDGGGVIQHSGDETEIARPAPSTVFDILYRRAVDQMTKHNDRIRESVANPPYSFQPQLFTRSHSCSRPLSASTSTNKRAVTSSSDSYSTSTILNICDTNDTVEKTGDFDDNAAICQSPKQKQKTSVEKLRRNSSVEKPNSIESSKVTQGCGSASVNPVSSNTAGNRVRKADAFYQRLYSYASFRAPAPRPSSPHSPSNAGKLHLPPHDVSQARMVTQTTSTQNRGRKKTGVELFPGDDVGRGRLHGQFAAALSISPKIIAAPATTTAKYSGSTVAPRSTSAPARTVAHQSTTVAPCPATLAHQQGGRKIRNHDNATHYPSSAATSAKYLRNARHRAVGEIFDVLLYSVLFSAHEKEKSGRLQDDGKVDSSSSGCFTQTRTHHSDHMHVSDALNDQDLPIEVWGDTLLGRLNAVYNLGLNLPDQLPASTSNFTKQVHDQPPRDIKRHHTTSVESLVRSAVHDIPRSSTYTESRLGFGEDGRRHTDYIDSAVSTETTNAKPERQKRIPTDAVGGGEDISGGEGEGLYDPFDMSSETIQTIQRYGDDSEEGADEVRAFFLSQFSVPFHTTTAPATISTQKQERDEHMIGDALDLVSARPQLLQPAILAEFIARVIAQVTSSAPPNPPSSSSFVSLSSSQPAHHSACTSEKIERKANPQHSTAPRSHGRRFMTREEFVYLIDECLSRESERSYRALDDLFISTALQKPPKHVLSHAEKELASVTSTPNLIARKVTEKLARRRDWALVQHMGVETREEALLAYQRVYSIRAAERKQLYDDEKMRECTFDPAPFMIPRK